MSVSDDRAAFDAAFGIFDDKVSFCVGVGFALCVLCVLYVFVVLVVCTRSIFPNPFVVRCSACFGCSYSRSRRFFAPPQRLVV